MEPKPIQIPTGKSIMINVNSIMDYVITTRSGSEITGFILPNNPLKVTNGGDLARFDLNVRQAPSEDFQIIE